MKLSKAEREQLLSEPHVAVIAIERTGRAPIAVPIWYDVAPDGTVWIMTGTESLKAQLLRSAGRCTLTVDTVTPRTQFVAVECELVEERERTDTDLTEMGTRYLGESAPGYIAWAKDALADEQVFVLRPVDWRSGDFTL